ncbi:hypothetical protein TNCV_4977591 [Trichonephila clavipes]|nr:hypothetical protein TNCV_4977591 [Trichonephila clavipes]
MSDPPDFQRDQIEGARQAEASVTETSQLLDISIGTVSKVVTACMQRSKTSSLKQKSGQKEKLGMNWRGENFLNPTPVVFAVTTSKNFRPTYLTRTYSVCTRRVFGGMGHRTQGLRSDSDALTSRLPMAPSRRIGDGIFQNDNASSYEAGPVKSWALTGGAFFSTLQTSWLKVAVFCHEKEIVGAKALGTSSNETRLKLPKRSACVLKCEISEILHKFLEDSRGSRTRHYGRQCHQYGRQLPNWWPTWSPKMMPTRLYHQDLVVSIE